MGHRIFVFTFIPALSGFFAAMLFLGQRRHDGPLLFLSIALIGELPAILVTAPVTEVLHWFDVFENHDFLLLVGVPTLMNLGLFALAGFVSWRWFPTPQIDSSAEKLLNHLNRAGWSMQDSGSSSLWVVTGVMNDKVIQGEGGSRVEAFRHAYEQATRMNLKAESSSNIKSLFAFLLIALGYLLEAVFGWALLMVYSFASMHEPGTPGTKLLFLTLGKMLDPREMLWLTLFFLIGVLGGLLLVFRGCLRLAQITDPNVATNNAVTQERSSVP